MYERRKKEKERERESEKERHKHRKGSYAISMNEAVVLKL